MLFVSVKTVKGLFNKTQKPELMNGIAGLKAKASQGQVLGESLF